MDLLHKIIAEIRIKMGFQKSFSPIVKSIGP
jgi:hypothetical protein